MAVYFMVTRVTGVIGIVTSILSALYTFAAGLLLNFIIQRTRGSDLRLRIATGGGSSTLLREYYAAGRRMWGGRHAALLGILILTFSGNAIPFIVNTGIKAGMGMVPLGSLRTWNNSMGFGTHDVGLAYHILSEAKPTTINNVNAHYEGAVAPDHPVPGTISLTRQLYTFSQNNTPSCEVSFPNCELTSMRTTIPPGADYTKLFDTPWVVTYNDHQGRSIPIANLTSATAMANSNRDDFIAERPTTFIAGYTDTTGQSVLAAFTTASFSYRIRASDTESFQPVTFIGSRSHLYPLIWKAMNASAFSPPLIGATASNKATLIYNTPSSSSDNLTHITCVGYEADTSTQEQEQNGRPSAVNMMSCRELHIAIMSNTGATFNPNTNAGYDMFKIYNALAPNQVSPEEIDYHGGENVTAVAEEMTAFLHNITERLYPFVALYQAQAQVFELKEGISFEPWSVVFMGTLVGIVVLMYLLEWWLVEDVYKADVLTLIETTTLGGVGGATTASTAATTTKKMKKEEKKRWSKRKYPKWSLDKDGDAHHVLLRGERVLVEKPAERRRLKGADYA
ncbi:hypothetical protein EMPS_09271 [Entomortierella parvispora]|uniref:Uncharacterized protein n=1 Tax=Entomortierella parvispora TaxID=205924 RepID=A0A9P3M086_9FUNG|nr:hypothetical protein EMPS_09271 [Entomortierella parvispora]